MVRGGGAAHAVVPRGVEAAAHPHLAKAAGPALETPAPASASSLSPEVAALADEKKTLDEALLHGYDAEKVKRLAEVEAALAKANYVTLESALSPEEAAKAAWMARTYG